MATTVLFSSHQLADVEQIADHIAIVDRGRVVVDGALDDRPRALPAHSARVRRRRARRRRSSRAASSACGGKGRVMSVLSNAGEEGVVAEARALSPTSVDVHPVTLKEIFLETVGVEN